ncbi:MAG: SUMF1/EgtB/PvdO family nonheme iron enzyme [Elusimicrobiota bacterium]|nr:SUMF1/EgtB/PvdO family nonheme iron enzyme [Elusimicrobiota bacterium]
MNPVLLLIPLLAWQSVQAAPSKPAPNPAGIQWVKIPGGSFMMGSDTGDMEGPAHKVTLKPFEMSKSVVTNKQWKACVAAGKCETPEPACLKRRLIHPGKQRLDRDDQPAVCMSVAAADRFAEWAGGFIPTEAQWEYAARSAGKDRTYPWDDEKIDCERAVIHPKGGAAGCGSGESWPVCSKPKGHTAQGLCDMVGNVQQWTKDLYKNTYAGAPTDGSARLDKGLSYRVIRGSAWGQQDYFHVTWRNVSTHHAADPGLGLRLVR